MIILRRLLLYLYSRVSADFSESKFARLLRYMQPFPWEIGSLGCRFWVVFAVKTVTLLWQPVEIAREHLSSTAIFCWNLLNSHYDYQRASADLKNKHSIPDIRVVEVVYWHKNHICLWVWQWVCSYNNRAKESRKSAAIAVGIWIVGPQNDEEEKGCLQFQKR